MKTTALFLALLASILSFSSLAAAPALQTQIYTTREGLAGDFITAIAFEPDGSTWVGTSEGATHISDAGWVSYTRDHGLGDSYITSIAVAPDGLVWLGTQSGGLSVLDSRAKTFTTYNLDNSEIPSNFVTAVAVTGDNQVWVGTLDAGIARFDPHRHTWTRYPQPGNEITAISLQSNGQPWVGTPDNVWFGYDRWEHRNAGTGNVRRMDTLDGMWFLTTDNARYRLLGDTWVPTNGKDAVSEAIHSANLSEGQVTAFGKDAQSRYWIGTAYGIFLLHSGNAPHPPTPLPVVLVHGWTVAGDDTLATSEFRFLESYADRDGIPVYYLRGVSPKNTLYQNAAVLRDEIARVKQATGASKVNVIAFSMGGMNTRAYLETTLYADDVNRAIILGTPQAGVEVWKPILFQQILEKPDQPSAIELSPEYAQQIVNATRSPNPAVAYDLLIGDARKQAGLDFLSDMPASDALISVASALALDAPNVRKHVNTDLHDWGPEAVPIDLTGYLYPRATWDRYLRNSLRNGGTAPLGAEVSAPPAPLLTPGGEETAADSVPVSNHTPVVRLDLRGGETVTQTVQVDANRSARFIAYYPGGQVDFSLVAPDGRKFEPSDLPQADGSGVLSLSTDVASFSGYVVHDAPIGNWQLVLTRTDNGTAPIPAAVYVELNTPLHLEVFLRSPTLVPGKPAAVTAQVVLDPHAPPPPARIRAQIAQPPSQAGAPFILTDLEMYDDGQHADGAAGDGFFGGTFIPQRAGWHLVFVQAAGDGFVRETETMFAVDANDGHFAAPATVTRANGVWTLHAPVEVQRPGEYALGAVVRPRGTADVILRQLHPVQLQSGSQTVSFTLNLPQTPARTYAVDLILLDANGAAVELDRTPVPLSITQP